MKRRGHVAPLALSFSAAFLVGLVLVGVTWGAPRDLTLPSLIGAQEVSLEAFAGRPTLLIFWTVRCPYCKKELLELKDLLSSRDLSFNVVAIAYARGKSEVEETRKWVEENGPFRGVEFLLDSDGKAFAQHDVRFVPHNVLLGPDLQVRKVIPGAVPPSLLIEEIEGR